MEKSKKCLGCRLANKIEPVNVIFEDHYVCCILDHDPFNEGHVMILPKLHYEDIDEVDVETANAIIQVSRVMAKVIKNLYKPDGITICQNGGIFSELSHFHMHVVPRYKHQSFADFYLERPLDNENLKSKLAVTKEELIRCLRKMM